MTEELNNKLLLAKDDMKLTVCPYASIRGKQDLLQKIWVWAKNVLTTEAINKELLLAKNCMGQSA